MGLSRIVAGQEDMHVHVHLSKALIYRLNVGMSFLLAAALLSLRRHKIRADNIYLKGAVE